MATSQLILCDPLCFIVNKFGKFSLNLLKSTVSDFYDIDAVVQAKKQLLDDIDNLSLEVKMPHIPRRRDGVNRIIREVEDIFTALTFLDENRLLHSLPRYVIDNPDNLPSIRLFEGDLKCLMVMLDKLENKLDSNRLEISSLRSVVYSSIHQSGYAHTVVNNKSTANQLNEQSRDHFVGIDQTDPIAAQPVCTESGISTINGTTGITAMPSTSSNTRSTEAVGKKAVPGFSWAERVTSTPSVNRYDVLRSVNEDIDDNDVDNSGAPYTTVESNNQYKRRRRQRQQQDSVKRPPPQSSTESSQQLRRSGNQLLVGKARMQDVQLSAAKKLYNKAVVYVDNLKPATTVDSLKQFVENKLGISVVSCFPVKPRRLRGDDEDPEIRKTVRSAFRLCVRKDDIDRLLVDSRWPDSVIVSKWIFNKKELDGGKRRKIDSGQNGDQSTETLGTCILSSTKPSGNRNEHQVDIRGGTSSSSSVSDVDPYVDMPLMETSPKESDSTILAGTSGYFDATIISNN